MVYWQSSPIEEAACSRCKLLLCYAAFQEHGDLVVFIGISTLPTNPTSRAVALRAAFVLVVELKERDRWNGHV